jgi:DNA-binding XRE family transcriptional regulator
MSENADPLAIPVEPHPDNVILFGLMLERARTTRELSRAELARQLGVRRDSIRNWERGVCNPPPATKALLIERFALTAADVEWSIEELARIRRGETSLYV